ncbi:hypothetical protein GEMRC1_006892 [Eukaryota sp. GEM-RC1]
MVTLAVYAPRSKHFAHVYQQLLREAKLFGCRFLFLDSLNYNTSVSIDLVMHKVSDFATYNRSYTFPNLYRVIDSSHVQQLALSRQSMFQPFRLNDPLKPPRLSFPTTFSLPSDNLDHFITDHIGCPCIVKPDVACGSASSHRLFIFPNLNTLADLSLLPPADYIVQPFLPCYKLIKLYAVVPSPQLNRNFYVWSCDFTSSHPKVDLDSPSVTMFDSQSVRNNKPNALLTNYPLLVDIALYISNRTGFTFFGVDLVQASDDVINYSCVDINYLPSFEGCVDFGKLALSCLLEAFELN